MPLVLCFLNCKIKKKKTKKGKKEKKFKSVGFHGDKSSVLKSEGRQALDLVF